jgi:hypothetical protein
MRKDRFSLKIVLAIALICLIILSIYAIPIITPYIQKAINTLSKTINDTINGIDRVITEASSCFVATDIPVAVAVNSNIEVKSQDSTGEQIKCEVIETKYNGYSNEVNVTYACPSFYIESETDNNISSVEVYYGN